MKKNKSSDSQPLSANYSEDSNFEFSLKWEKVAPIYQKTISTAAQKMKHKGFRPGKVPSHLAEELIDPQYLIQEVLRPLVDEAYREALAQQKIVPVDDPEIMVKSALKNKDWLLIAYLPQKPVINLPDYKKIIAEQKKINAAKLEEKSEKPSVSAKKEDKDKASKKPPTKLEINNRSTDQALLFLLQEIKPKISPILVKRAAQKEFERMLKQLQAHQLTLEEYLKNIGSNQENLSQQLMLNALQNLQMEFILDALIVAEKITVNDEELLAKLTEVMPDLKEEKEKTAQLEQKEVRVYLELLAKRKKLADWLLSL